MIAAVVGAMLALAVLAYVLAPLFARNPVEWPEDIDADAPDSEPPV